MQAKHVKFWQELDSEVDVISERTIEGALNSAKSIGDRGHGVQILITGSLHLVGGALSLLS